MVKLIYHIGYYLHILKYMDNVNSLIKYEGIDHSGCRFIIISYKDTMNPHLNLGSPITVIRLLGPWTKRPHVIHLYDNYNSLPLTITAIAQSINEVPISDFDELIHAELITYNFFNGKKLLNLGTFLRECKIFEDKEFLSNFTVSRYFDFINSSFATI